MEVGESFKIALTILCFSALPLFFAVHALKCRNARRRSGVCYLKRQSKPQHSFSRVLADNSYSPFKHLRLGYSGVEDSPNSHPYEAQIRELLENPPADYGFSEGETGLSTLESSSHAWVDTESGLQDLACRLRRTRFFSVDTEQHSLRSFLGITALMQISTGEEDFLVDTLALHDAMRILRPVFADPSICKVFHGADNDVLWLQRDFHIYVVNLFDTAKACDVLAKPLKSLAYLLETYCAVTTNKLFQLEDWRQRPLPVEMAIYARTDAHFLLHIAGNLVSELRLKSTGNPSLHDEGRSDFVMEASRRSNRTCLQLYTKEIREDTPGESSASSILSRCSNAVYAEIEPEANGHLRFQALIRRLCTWREIMARIHDESIRYVLSDQAIVAIASAAPRNPDEICSAILRAADHTLGSPSPYPCHPSPVIHSHLDSLCELIEHGAGDLTDFLAQKHGSCPLSRYNSALLREPSSQLASRSETGNGAVKCSRRKKMAMKKVSSRALFVQKFSCKAPVYHNCKIYASDGRLLCYCDRKKVEWYLRRGLSVTAGDDPTAIVLLFEPRGRPEDGGNEFYIQNKENMCVGCGEKKHYLRYRIIPSCYRTHFPEHLKSHRSHDIVLLCVDCHELAHSASEKYKRRVASEYGVPLFLAADHDNGRGGGGGVSPLHLRTAAMALLRHGERMPPGRREELTRTVAGYYGKAEVTEEDVGNALLVGMSPRERRKLKTRGGGGTAGVKPPPLLGHGPHGMDVINHILEQHGDDGILQFCQRWRQVFIETVRPRYLPAGWDVNHSGRREFGEHSVYRPPPSSGE